MNAQTKHQLHLKGSSILPTLGRYTTNQNCGSIETKTKLCGKSTRCDSEERTTWHEIRKLVFIDLLFFSRSPPPQLESTGQFGPDMNKNTVSGAKKCNKNEA